VSQELSNSDLTFSNVLCGFGLFVAVDKTYLKPSRGEVALPVVEQIRQAAFAKIPPQSKVIVLDKGDGDVLGLNDLQEWHFPRRKGRFARKTIRWRVIERL
jgi:hypothetical protein